MVLVFIWYNDRYRSKVSINSILPWPLGHKGKKLGYKVSAWKNHVYTSEGTVLVQSLSEYLSQLNLGQDQNWVMSGQNLGNKVNS